MIVASVSGGKDSAALCMWLREQGLEFRAVHMDTGWEHPSVDEYLRGDLERAVGPIEWIVPQRRMADLIRHKGIFPARVLRFCTQQLKMIPFIDWLQEQYPDGNVINAIGIRAEESQARAKLTICNRNEWGAVWRPLLRWTEQDVIDIHRRHDLKPAPLYMLGARRVGCWPCIFSSKADIRLVAKLTPERIDEIRGLEKELYDAYLLRHAGELLRTYPTFFTIRDGGSPKHRAVGIDEAVAWARTSRGGRQMTIDVDDEREGCMRWGLCDA